MKIFNENTTFGTTELCRYCAPTHVSITIILEVLYSNYNHNEILHFQVVWFRGRQHRVIAATFTDGYVGLWDIETTSSLLRDEKSCSIYPYRFFRTHLRNSQTFLDLSSEADGEGFPLHLFTGSTDRVVTSWDLGSASTLGDVPVRECRKHFVTDVTWLDHFPGNVSISHDDSCLQSNTRYNSRRPVGIQNPNFLGVDYDSM